MNTLGIRKTNHERSELADMIHKFRLDHNMTQEELGRAAGESAANIGLLENQMKEKGSKISVRMHRALTDAGVDFSTVSDLKISTRKERSKHTLSPDYTVKISKQDPIKLLNQAKELARKAASIITDETKKIEEATASLNEKRETMKTGLESFKNDIIEL